MKRFLCLLLAVAIVFVLSAGGEHRGVAEEPIESAGLAQEVMAFDTDKPLNTRTGDNAVNDGIGITGRESAEKELDSLNAAEGSAGTMDAEDNMYEDPCFVFPEKGARPVAVMIDNEGTRPLPQGGIDKAQVVYEAVVEYDITRLMAVFWNVNPSMIGPVRSARHYFLDYSMEHDAIYVHVGWSPMAQSDISKYKINNANGVSNGGWIFHDITNDPYNWQDTYTTMEKILQYSKGAEYSLKTGRRVFQYRDSFQIPDEGAPARNIELVYSSDYNCGYEYDGKTGLYKRFRMGKAHMERTSGSQLECANIIIQRVANHTIEGDREGRQDLENAGKGTGCYITGGKVMDIKWYKSSRTEPTLYRDTSGGEIILNPGRTWVQIMPVYGKITIH